MRKSPSVDILIKSIAAKINEVFVKTECKPLLIFTLIFLPCSNVNATQIDATYSGEIDRLMSAECLGYSSSGSCNSWDHTDVIESFFYEGIRISDSDSFSGTFLMIQMHR